MPHAFRRNHALTPGLRCDLLLPCHLANFSYIDWLLCGMLGRPAPCDVPHCIDLVYGQGQNLCLTLLSSPVQGIYIWLNWTDSRFLLMLFLLWESFQSLLQPCLPQALLHSVTSEQHFAGFFQEPAYMSSLVKPHLALSSCLILLRTVGSSRGIHSRVRRPWPWLSIHVYGMNSTNFIPKTL